MRASAARSSRACISAEPVDCQAAATWMIARERRASGSQASISS